MTSRSVIRTIPAQPTQDGGGVKLLRSLGQSGFTRLDPFLMLDEFSSDEADDYIAGFPDHPHRGFETVTYMLDGHLLHQDHMGNRGELTPGDVQWMTAGRGIIHSEMPLQKSGRMRGFQLWINLPAAEKMKPAGYRDLGSDEIPRHTLGNGCEIRLIAGALRIEHQPIQGPMHGLSTEPVYADVILPAHASLTLPIPAGHNAFVYVFEGEATVSGETLPTHSANVLSDGESFEVSGGPDGGRLLLIAGKPIGEPVVQYGPFVMNTQEQIEQALRDYRDGKLTD